MTPDELSAIAGVVLSLFFSYWPGLKWRFKKLRPEYKRLIMLGLLFVTALGIFGLSCWQIFAIVACTRDGAIGLFRIFVIAVIANQATFQISPKPKNPPAVPAEDELPRPIYIG